MATASAESSARVWIRLALFIALIGGMFLLGRALGLGERLREAQRWIAEIGPLGPIVFIGLYAVSVALSAPASVLTVMAGALFGSIRGVIIVSVAATLGAGLAFLLARYLAREAVAQRFANNPHFQRLDRLTAEHGAVVVAITRLVPIFPFNLLNYGFGLTRIPFRTYLFWSWLCMLPGTVLYVVGADAVVRALTEGQLPWPLLGVLLGVGAGIALVARRARKKWKALDRQSPPEGGS